MAHFVPAGGAMAIHDGATDGRRMPAFLLLIMLTIPALGVWFFWARGFRPDLRRTALFYALAIHGVGLLGAIAT
ncbi:MAG: hypothetical protein ACK4TC_08195 [Sphingomonas pseudosanguinis]|uniref:hypothetical protein n=1 Tax=Sphingomonas pseudosanguinis TaxID=413712 RepID=UPI00391DEB0F